MWTNFGNLSARFEGGLGLCPALPHPLWRPPIGGTDPVPSSDLPTGPRAGGAVLPCDFYSDSIDTHRMELAVTHPRFNARATASFFAPRRAPLGPRAQRVRRGLTLVEAAVGLAIASMALGAALPNFRHMLEQRRIEAAAAQLETDLQFTRTVAVAQNRTVRFELLGDTQGTCYVVHNGGAGDCQCTPAGAVCSAGVQVHRAQHYARDSGVAVAANVRSMVFEPMKGTVTPTATLRVEGQRFSVRQIVNIMGRIRSCSPEGALPGLKAC